MTGLLQCINFLERGVTGRALLAFPLRQIVVDWYEYMISKQVTRCSFPEDGRFTALCIQELIHLYARVKIEDAAKQLGLGVTALKKRCRQVGIQRWPHRQVSEQM